MLLLCIFPSPAGPLPELCERLALLVIYCRLAFFGYKDPTRQCSAISAFTDSAGHSHIDTLMRASPHEFALGVEPFEADLAL